MKTLFRVLRWTLTALILLVLPNWSAAQDRDEEVDVQLVLAVDVSRSMTPWELEIQRRGYATALASKDVINAIKGGLLGRVAIIYLEWAGNYSHRIIVDWTMISNGAEAKAFARQLTLNFNPSLRRTSISGALDFSSDLFDSNGFTSNRRIIDISGDGPNNQGRPVLAARHDTLARGIVINGLPLMTREGIGARFHLENLDEYYENCVIGGPGSFVLAVTDWQQFPVAVRQKLILELARIPGPPVINAAATGDGRGGFDCLIGEKMWEQMMDYWGEP